MFGADSLLLDPRAPAWEIAGHAIYAAGCARGLVTDVGKSHKSPQNESELHARLDTLARTYGANQVPYKKGQEIGSVIARMADVSWWKKGIRRNLLRENERQEREAGAISKQTQVYVSDYTVNQKEQQRKANQLILECMEVVSDQGDVVNLAEAVEGSISNPKHRRAELMTRCRGFEEASIFMGHTAWFLTFTTPKRYHCNDAFGGRVKKWDGATPKDGQEYLCKIWRSIRAAWKNAGIVVYGFRVAEPHQDGTPHWHVLIFCKPEDSKRMLAIAGNRARAKDRYESGAKAHRFTAKRIDPAAGSATGYIAKYICKNIDGMQEDGEMMGQDMEAESPADSAARRVRDWASTWGIRQFQQIGGPSVTVWREFRRLGEGAALQLDLFELPRAAADKGSWFEFWLQLGGPDVPSRRLKVRPLYKKETSQKYGDEVTKVKGVQGVHLGKVEEEPTRLKEWTVQRAGLDAVNRAQAEFSIVPKLKAKEAEFMQAYEDAEFKRIGEAKRTRTGVNNCISHIFNFDSFPVEPDWVLPPSDVIRRGSEDEIDAEVGRAIADLFPRIWEVARSWADAEVGSAYRRRRQ